MFDLIQLHVPMRTKKSLVEIGVHSNSAESHSYFLFSYLITERFLAASNKLYPCLKTDNSNTATKIPP